MTSKLVNTRDIARALKIPVTDVRRYLLAHEVPIIQGKYGRGTMRFYDSVVLTKAEDIRAYASVCARERWLEYKAKKRAAAPKITLQDRVAALEKKLEGLSH